MGNDLVFRDDEAAKFREITGYYELSKELLIFGEQVHPQNKSFTQTINELRNCLDHIMRATAFKLGLRKVESEEGYVLKNLDKAYGHVYRAAYDTLDWVSIILRERIRDELQDFSLETIQAALPDYFTLIKPRIEHLLSNEVTKLRNEKDVAAKSEQNLISYTKVIAELKDLWQKVINALPALAEAENRLKRSERRQLIRNIGVGVGVAIIAFLLGRFI